MLKPEELLKLVATSTFRPFTKTDWYGFAGCETKEPLIAELEDQAVIIIDGATVSHIPADGDNADNSTVMRLF